MHGSGPTCALPREWTTVLTRPTSGLEGSGFGEAKAGRSERFGFLREFADFVRDVEELALAGGGESAAARVAAQTTPQVVTFAWLLCGGVHQVWAQDIDREAWRTV